MDKTTTVDRRNFLSALGVTVGGTGLAGAGLVAGPQLVAAQTAPPKGRIPDTPYKTGHMTFLTGPAAVLGDPSLKGHIMAAEEINAKGGLLGKRKIETITADEAAGTDANVKELRRMKLEGKIDLFTGIISSGNTPGARSGRRGAEPADDLRRRLHRLPVRQGGAEAEIHLPPHQHPIGGRHHRGDRRGAGMAASAQDRASASRLQLRAQRGRALHPGVRAAGARHPGRVRKLAQARHHRLHVAHHQDHVGASRICCSPRSGAATMWPGTSRRCATACSRR